MKKILFLILILSSFVSYSQTEEIVLAEGRYGKISTEFLMNIENGDSTYMYLLKFVNADYKYHIDTKIKMITDKIEFEELKDFFAKASEWDMKKKLSDTSNDFFISTEYVYGFMYFSYDGGYNGIKQKQLKQLAEDMRKIDLNLFN